MIERQEFHDIHRHVRAVFESLRQYLSNSQQLVARQDLQRVHCQSINIVPASACQLESNFGDFSGNAEHPELKKRPTEYFKSNFMVAARGDERTLPAVCELVGDDYVTFNTDYPHPDGTWPRGMSDLEAQPLSEESLRKIFWSNAAPWFGLA